MNFLKRLFKRPAAQTDSPTIQEHPPEVLAEYLWGRNTLVLNPYSVLAHGLYAKTLAGLTQRVIPINSAAELRGMVALLHELTHCVQDNATGVGLSDWLVRAEVMPKALEFGRTASWGLDTSSALADLTAKYQS